MRIIGGQFRGKHLATPKSEAIRPTSDRLRESLFNILVNGFEALSRGARFATFVDDGTEARGLIRTNIDAMALGGRTRLFKRDATRLGAIGPIEPFSLAFLDPPYRKGLAEPALTSLAGGGWLTADALCVVEEAADAEWLGAEGFTLVDKRDYGETTIRFLRFTGKS